MLGNQRLRYTSVLAIALVGSCLLRTADAQVMTVAANSTDDLLSQFRTVARAINPQAAQPLLAIVDNVANGGSLKAIDRTQPIIITLDLIPQPQAGPAGLPVFTLYVPTTSEADLLDTLKANGLTVSKPENAPGFSQMIRPQGNNTPIFLLENPPKGYTVATTYSKNADQLRPNKPANLKPNRPGTLLTTVRLDLVPDQTKDLFFANLKQRNEVSRQRRAGETDESYRGRLVGINLTEEASIALVRDGRELTLDLGVDPKGERCTLTLGANAKPDTDMARSLATLTARTSLLRAIPHKGTSNLVVNYPISESLRNFFLETTKKASEKASKENKPEEQQIIRGLLDIFEQTLKAPTLDAFATLVPVSPNGEKSSTAGPQAPLFGIVLSDSKKAEAALREIATKLTKPEDRKRLALDHTQGDQGVPIHRITLPPESWKADQLGEPYLYLAFPENAILVALGGHGLAPLKQALVSLNSSRTTPKTANPEISLNLAVTQVLNFSPLDPNILKEAANQAFNASTPAKDHASLRLKGTPDRFSLTLESDLSILRFLATIGAQQQKAKAAPNP